MALIRTASLWLRCTVMIIEQWDFSASLDFEEMFGWSEFVPQLTLDVINMTDEEQRSYFQYTNATFTQYEPGRTVIVGFRGKF